MEMSDNDFQKFFKRWYFTVGYIAIVLTIMLGIRLYEVFGR